MIILIYKLISIKYTKILKPLKIHYTLHPFLYHNQKLIHQKMMIMKSFKHKLTYFSQGDFDEFDGTEPFLSISENIQELQPDYIRLVSKIIAICSFFSRSSVSQDQLEIICSEKKHKSSENKNRSLPKVVKPSPNALNFFENVSYHKRVL